MTVPTNPLSYNQYIQNVGVMAVALTQENAGIWQFDDATLQCVLNHSKMRDTRDAINAARSLTTMHLQDATMAKSKDTKFYVYEHWRTDTNRPFYVGKGQGARSTDMYNGRNRLHKIIQDQVATAGARIEVKMIAKQISEDDAFALEREKIAFWRSAGMELANLSKGGEGASGYKHTPEAIAKCMAFHTGRKRSPETRERIAAKARGRKPNSAVIEMLASINRGRKRIFSAEHRAKISANSKGRKMLPHVMEALRASHLGKSRTQTPETRAKISAARTGRKFGPLSESHRAAISAGNKGKPKSSEHRAKLSAARFAMAKKTK